MNLNKHQINVLKKTSVSGDDVLKNLDSLNEEIFDSHKDLVVKEELPVKEEFEEVDPDADLQKELAHYMSKAKAVEAEAKKVEKTEVKEPELTQEEMQRRAIYDALAKIPGAPTPAQVEAMKAKYGKNGIHVLALGEDDIYIFTYLRRSQFEVIGQIVEAAAKSDLGSNADKLMKEKVVQRSVIWPTGVSSPEFLYNARAGVLDTLYQAIMVNSYFLTPQQTMMLTTQL